MMPQPESLSTPCGETAETIPPLVLCLGNELIGDDAFGPTVHHILVSSGPQADIADILFSPRAGLTLLELLDHRQRVLIIDTIVTGRAEPGTLHVFPMMPGAPGRHLTSSHQIGLPTVLELGTCLGYAMPAQVDVIAVEAADVVTLGAPLSDAVSRALPRVVDRVNGWLRGQTLERSTPLEAHVCAR